MAGLGKDNPCWGCGQPFCHHPAETCDRAKRAADQAEVSRLRKQVQELTKPSRGQLINEHASLGAEIARIKSVLPDVDKQSRKTPPKTLLAEKAKVALAKIQFFELSQQLEKLTIRHQELTTQLREMKAWG